MTPQLNDELAKAVDSHQGCLKVESGGQAYIVMSQQTYRETMGVGDDTEFAESIAAIQRGLADVEAGRSRPVSEFFREFDERHESSS